mgnify:FL=1
MVITKKSNICQNHLKQVVNTLAASANATLFKGKEDTDQTVEPSESSDDDDNLSELSDTVPVEKANLTSCNLTWA